MPQLVCRGAMCAIYDELKVCRLISAETWHQRGALDSGGSISCSRDTVREECLYLVSLTIGGSSKARRYPGVRSNIQCNECVHCTVDILAHCAIAVRRTQKVVDYPPH